MLNISFLSPGRLAELLLFVVFCVCICKHAMFVGRKKKRDFFSLAVHDIYAATVSSGFFMRCDMKQRGVHAACVYVLVCERV